MKRYQKKPIKLYLPATVLLLAILITCYAFDAQALENSKSSTKLQQVNLQLKWKHQFQFAGYYIAQSKGFYRDENLKVNIAEGGHKRVATAMVASGQAQYGIGDSAILVDFANGKPLVVLSAIFQHSPYILLTRADSNLKRPSDLIGKRVMLSGDQGADEFKVILKNEGIAIDKIDALNQSWNLQDLIDGKVDAVSAYISVEPNYLRAKGIEPGIIHSVNYGIDFYGDTLFTNRHELETNPKRVDAFIRASQKGWNYALAHKEEAADLILQMDGVRERGISKELLLAEARDMEALILSDIIEVGHINPLRWQSIARELSKTTLIKEDIDLTDFIYAPSKTTGLSKQDTAMATFVLAAALLSIAVWYFRTRKKIRINAEKLQRSEDLLKIASNLAQLGGWDLELKNKRMTWSDEVALLHDMPPGSIPTLESASGMIAPEWREQMTKNLDQCIANGTPYDQEFQKITAKNRHIWVRSVAQPVRNQDGKVIRIQGAFQDISKYKNLELFNNQQSSILENIASGAPLTKVLDECVKLIESKYPELICVINLLDESGLHLKTGTVINMPADYIDAINGLKIGADAGSCGTAVYERREIIVADIANDPIWKHHKEIALKHHLLACWSWPIFSSKGLVIGTFAAYSKQIAAPLDEQAQLIRSITKTVGIAIEKDKTFEQIYLLESAISRLNDIVLITHAEPIGDPGPITVYVNDAFERRTGFSKEEIIGHSPRILQGPKTDKVQLKRIRDALEKWEPVRAELINYTKSGEEFWLELDIVPIADASGWYTHWVAIERDISKRKANELEMLRLNRALRLLSSCNEVVMRVKDEHQLISEICKLAVEIGGYSMAWVGYAQHDENKSIVPVGSYGTKGEFLNQLNLSWSEDNVRGKGPGGKTIRDCKTIIVEDISKDPSYPATKEAHQEGYFGLISLPLVENGQCFGLLAMYETEVLAIPAEEIKLLEEIADDLAFGIANIRSKIEQEKMQAAVSRVASSVSMSTGNQFLEQLVQNMVIASDADAGFIATLSPDAQLTASTIVAIVDGVLVDNLTYDLNKSPCNQLLKSEHFVLSKATSKCFPSDTMVLLGMKDYVGQRLINNKGKIIGMIFVMKREIFKHDEFTVSTIKIFATRASAEIERQNYDRHISEQASLLDKAQDAIIVRGMDYRIQFWNKGAERLYGWTESEALGQSIVDLIYTDQSVFYECDKTLHEMGEFSREVTQKRKDKSELFAEVRWTLVKDDMGQAVSVLCINTDITQRKVASEEIQYMAFYDALTKLPNRLLLQDRLKHALVSSARSDKYGALLFIDIDNFKTINDTMGHAAGDILLQKIANRLQSNTRDSDTVSRLGGDEFIIMIEELHVELKDAAILSKVFAEKLVKLFEESFDIDSHKHYSSPSIGITLFKGETQSVTELLKQADLAMYQSKAAGRNTLRFYDPQMQTAVSNRVEIEIDLRQALAKNEFLLHYQPQMNSQGECIGAEALLRWVSGKKGMISPAIFIPLAEETRLILPIGEWVLVKACETLSKWGEIPEMANVQLAVNVSVHQFRSPNFVDQVSKIVKSARINPARLKLELTESIFVENLDDITFKMVALKEQGIAFSLDDFGTGYSSLSYLKRLPFNQLKIDQSFIRDVLTDSHSATITRSIITLAKSLGLEVIAEGVELIEQKEFLVNEDCHLYQGYHFSRPLPLDKLESFVKDLAKH
ncbi:MAG: EAL domain-containing protein [Pseudomonadota bacterium]